MLSIILRGWRHHLPHVRAVLVIAGAVTIAGCGGNVGNPIGPDPITSGSGSSGASARAGAPDGANSVAVANARATDRVDICHRRARKDFVPLSVAPAAVAAHMSHGDGLVGGPVPEQPTVRFDANCGLQVTSQRIAPTVDGSIRDGLGQLKDGISDQVIGNSVVAVLHGLNFEDRGFVEFDISSLSQPVSGADLELPVFSANGPFPFTVNVLVYAGDGSLTLSDFALGVPVTSFAYTGASHETLDVTAAINSLLVSGASVAGFKFQMAVPSTIASNGPFVAFGSLEFSPAASLVIR